MKIEIFKELLDAANKKLVELALANGDVVSAKDVHVLISWWNSNFRPLDYIVAAPSAQLFIREDCPGIDEQPSLDETLVEMKTVAWECQTYTEKSWMPCPFAINKNAWNPDQVVVKTRTLDYVEEAMAKTNFGSLKIRVSSSPFDQLVDLDPWETKIIRNPSKQVMLCLGLGRTLEARNRSGGVYLRTGFVADEDPSCPEFDWKISSDMIKIYDYYRPDEDSCGCGAGS